MYSVFLPSCNPALLKIDPKAPEAFVQVLKVMFAKLPGVIVGSPLLLSLFKIMSCENRVSPVIEWVPTAVNSLEPLLI